MKILITGSRGMVGTEIEKVWAGHEIITPAKYQLNIGNFDQVMRFKSEKPEFVIHLSAETDHEYCDLNPSNCYYINTIGTANMMRLARDLNIPILYLSAGSVFDGLKNEPYTPEDKPNPINHYNSSKWYGELIVKEYERHFIVRAGWMFGGGPDVDKKFVNKIHQKILRGDKEIMVCDDCVGSPTYTSDLALAIQKAMMFNKYGTYHFVNESLGVSRYEFACEMIRILGKDVKITQCKIDDLKEEFPCKRTNYEVLRNDSSMMRGWKEALEDYLVKYYRH